MNGFLSSLLADSVIGAILAVIGYLAMKHLLHIDLSVRIGDDIPKGDEQEEGEDTEIGDGP